MKKLGMLCVLLLAMGCGDSRIVRPINANRVFQGVPAKGLVVVVPESFGVKSLRNENYIYTLQSGSYLAFVEDEMGIFFKAPEKIISSDNSSAKTLRAGSMLHDGGVFIDQVTFNAFLWLYIDYNGNTYVLPVEISADKFRLERKK